MATEVVDALVVTLGLDSSGYVKGQKEATASLKATGDQAASTAKEMQARGAQAAEFFSRIRNEALSLAAVLVGGKGLSAMIGDSVTNLSELGRSAHDIGIAVPNLAAMRNQIAAFGGDADAATASFQGLAQALSQMNSGQGVAPGLASFLGTIGGNASDSVQTLYGKFNAWAQGKAPERVISVGQMAGFDIGTIREAMKPTAQFQQDYADAMKRGVPTQAMTEDMQKLQTAWRDTEQAASHLADVFVDKLAPSLIVILNAVTKFIEDHPQAATDAGLVATAAGGYATLRGFQFLKGLLTRGGAVEAAEGAGGLGLSGLLTPLAAIGALGYLSYGGAVTVGDPHFPGLEGQNASKAEVEAEIRRQASAQGLDPDHMVKLARQESGLRTDVPNSPAGAIGVMQLMPGTAIDLGVNPRDWKQNIAGGLKYYKQQLQQYGGQYATADAAYNAGPYNPGVQFLGQTGDRSRLPTETKKYLDSIDGPVGSRPMLQAPANNNSVQINGPITVHTQATDATGIAKDLSKSLKDQSYVAQANQGIN